jgi:hypothetical protein
MSGGTFDYRQYMFEDIADQIKQYVVQNGTKREERSSWEDEYRHKYPDDIIQEFEKAVELLKLTKIYVNRIDYLLAGDDGEESFRTRLKEELSKIKTNNGV